MYWAMSILQKLKRTHFHDCTLLYVDSAKTYVDLFLAHFICQFCKNLSQHDLLLAHYCLLISRKLKLNMLHDDQPLAHCCVTSFHKV
jgi:hypothetical protein